MHQTNRIPAAGLSAREMTFVDSETTHGLVDATRITVPETPRINRGVVAESLWNSLPFANCPRNVRAQHASLRASFQASQARLIRAATEIDQLFSAVARAQLQIRGLLTGNEQARRAEYRDKLEEMRRQLSFDSSEATSLFGEDGGSRLPELVEERIEARLRSDIDLLVGALISKVEQLRVENVVGEISWNGAGGCVFHFFGEAFIRNASTISTRNEQSVAREGFNEVTTETKLTVARHATTHRKVRHEHRLESATRANLTECPTAVPAEITAVINAIPAWLRPVAAVVVGECVHERIIERDVGETVQEEIISRESVRTERYIDPAIVIGDYVLAGWGDREIKAAEAQAVRSTQRLKNVVAAAAADQVASLYRTLGASALSLGLVVLAGSLSRSVLLSAMAGGLAVGGALLLLYGASLRRSANGGDY